MPETPVFGGLIGGGTSKVSALLALLLQNTQHQYAIANCSSCLLLKSLEIKKDLPIIHRKPLQYGLIWKERLTTYCQGHCNNTRKVDHFFTEYHLSSTWRTHWEGSGYTFLWFPHNTLQCITIPSIHEIPYETVFHSLDPWCTCEG